MDGRSAGATRGGQLIDLESVSEDVLEYSVDEPPVVHVGAERTGSDWTISVTDEGIGIDPDEQAQIFEVFQRLHSHDEYEGTGLGLALCERIVERHDGETWVASDPVRDRLFGDVAGMCGVKGTRVCSLSHHKAIQR